MKKLITLLLVLTGCVGTMSATEYTVYFKPSSNWASASAWFALYMEPNSGSSSQVKFTETSSGSGLYKATYNSTYDKKIQIIRKDPNSPNDLTSTSNPPCWGWSPDLSCPSSDILIDNSSDSDWNFSTTETILSSSWLLAANRHIANGYIDWQGDPSKSASNVMSTTDNISYTLTVSNRPLKAGRYGFKFVGDDWYGNLDDSGNNYYIEIANDDYYDITYTFNRITKRGSAVATAKNQSPTIEYKYYIYDNDAASWKYDETHYITAFTGQSWSECEMTNVNGTYVYGISAKELTSSKRYGSRFVEKVIATGADDQTNFLWISDGNGASQGCRYYDCTSDGTYNIVFTYNPSASNYDLVTAQPKLSVTTGYYAAQSDAWSTGVAMTFDATNGVYKHSFAGIKGKYFVLSTNSDVTSNWDSYAIRPESGPNGSYNVNEFISYSGTGVTGENNGKTWFLPNDKDIDNVEITFNPIDNSWKVTPYITGSITTAGYATYSHGSAYKITGEGVGVYTITATAAGDATMSSDWNDSALPAGTGVVLQGSTSSATPYTVTPSDGSASIGTNLLVGSGDSEATITAEDGFEKYILANKTNGVKFYKWDGSSENNHNKLSAHKAYLRVPTGLTPAPEFFNFNFDFGGETTDVSEKVIVKSEKFLSEESVARNATAPVFNLKGQRVMNPTKGLYIINCEF